MRRLRTELSHEECVARLREQIQPLTLFSHMNIFRAPRSRVFGRVSDSQITLESSRDRYSKRLLGRLLSSDGGTILEYRWKAGVGHRFWGDARFDEEEILSFLGEWLGTQEA